MLRSSRVARALVLYLNLVLLAAFGRPDAAAAVGFITLTPADFLSADGVQSYYLSVGNVISSAPSQTLTSPSGQVFAIGIGGTNVMTFGSLPDMIDSLPGEWKYQIPSPANPLLMETYRFTIPSVSLSELTVARPTILQPANGSVVHGPFAFEWDPPGSNFALSGASDYLLERPGLLHITPNIPPELLPRTITFATSTAQSLDGHIGVIPPDDAHFDIIARLSFSRGIETKVTVTAVPEPTFLALFPTAGVMLIVFRRSR